MSYQRFQPKDLIYSTLVAKPEYSFIIHSGTVYKNNEILEDGYYNNKVKHISNGDVSFHEMNIDRPYDSMIYGFIDKSSTRYAYRTISTSQFDDGSQFQYGNILTQSYPFRAGLTRIFVPDGPEIDDQNFRNLDNVTHAENNKKYIRSLKAVIESQDKFKLNSDYGDLGTKEVNMVCIPGIFYGSKIDQESIELNYYITGTLAARCQDLRGDGVLKETYGPNVGATAGIAIYEQGLLLLTGSWDLGSGSYTDQFFGIGSSSPSWLSFGTGLPYVGTPLPNENVLSSSYEVKFKGTNKIPTLTMMAFAEKGKYNYSTNPSFLELTENKSKFISKGYFEAPREIKNITKSDFVNHSSSFESVTYISKIGIYDENKNLIAIATLANPAKKTASRDYLFKMRVDF